MKSVKQRQGLFKMKPALPMKHSSVSYKVYWVQDASSLPLSRSSHDCVSDCLWILQCGQLVVPTACPGTPFVAPITKEPHGPFRIHCDIKMRGPGGIVAGCQGSTCTASAAISFSNFRCSFSCQLHVLSKTQEEKSLVIWPYFLKVKLTEVYRICLLQLIFFQ